jgi:hypothetical protein
MPGTPLIDLDYTAFVINRLMKPAALPATRTASCANCWAAS